MGVSCNPVSSRFYSLYPSLDYLRRLVGVPPFLEVLEAHLPVDPVEPELEVEEGFRCYLRLVGAGSRLDPLDPVQEVEREVVPLVVGLQRAE